MHCLLALDVLYSLCVWMCAGGVVAPCNQCAADGSFCTHCVPPASGDCPICQHPWSAQDPVEMGWLIEEAAIVYSLTCLYTPALIYYRRCSNGWVLLTICLILNFSVQPKEWHCFDLRICCGGSRQCNGRLLYDGTSDAIFNYSNRSLFTYELCFNYADGMIITRLPFATHFQHLRKNYVRTDVLEGLCSRGTHR